MKKQLFLYLSFFIFSFFALLTGNELYASASAKTEVTITLKDETVDFSPNGYMPQAKVSHNAVSSLLNYIAVDTSTSEEVSLPIDIPGVFEITAYFSGNEKYSSAKATATITIESIKAKIITNYHTVAYSKMENPISYSIEPSFAKDFLNIKIEYFPIKDLLSSPQQSIDAPKDLGLYYTIFNVTSLNAGVICENKYLIYEIAPYRGKKLSAEERGLSVPPSFTCNFENLTTVYNPDSPIKCTYSLSPAAIKGEIMYKTIYRDGSSSDYSKTPPTEPGEYICGYFLGSTCIGEGSIFIDKIQTSITVNSVETFYVYGGITPTAQSEIPGIDISFTAFAIDENGNVSMEETPIPITKAGKYSIIAYPTDTKHYKRIYAYGQINIIPSTPEINISNLEHIYDGEEKQLQVSVSPSDVLYKIDYYQCGKDGEHILLSNYPTAVGEYMVIVTAYDNNGNYNPISQTVIMQITGGEKEKNNLLLIVFSGIIGFIIIGAAATFAIKRKKSNSINETEL